MGEKENKKEKMETDLSGHYRDKKNLHPPFAKLGGMTFSSWKDHRMPEMLWAVLAIGNWERERALDFFRHVVIFSKQNKDCFDVTLTGISKFPLEKRIAFIKHVLSWSDDTKKILRPLLFFTKLPGLSEWKSYLEEPTVEDAGKIANGVEKVLWHQSQEATDCRWVKFLSLIMAEKIKFFSGIKDINETLRGVFEYPNYGDLTHIRPFIRSSEIAPGGEMTTDYAWAEHFWDTCYQKTPCFPESRVDKNPFPEPKEWDKKRKHYMNETIRIRKTLIDHFLNTSTITAIDYRHEGVFGLALYALTLLVEIIISRIDFSVTGRLSLRSIVEARITLAYLFKKDNLELWESYRQYGVGQAKLVHLKLQEITDKPSSIDPTTTERIANEDKWQEFVSINLGHWDNTSLREISEDADLKDVYDKYYNWSSGYIHANWAAVREVSFEKCLNPLHRLHRLPHLRYPILPDVIKDSVKEINSILDLVSAAYPTYLERIKIY